MSSNQCIQCKSIENIKCSGTVFISYEETSLIKSHHGPQTIKQTFKTNYDWGYDDFCICHTCYDKEKSFNLKSGKSQFIWCVTMTIISTIYILAVYLIFKQSIFDNKNEILDIAAGIIGIIGIIGMLDSTTLLFRNENDIVLILFERSSPKCHEYHNFIQAKRNAKPYSVSGASHTVTYKSIFKISNYHLHN